MGFDWFTVVAQVVNFALLVWLLKRFLYKPILGAIDAREKKVAGLVADALAKKAEAESEYQQFQQKHAELEAHRQQLLQTAVADAKAERHRLIDAAHAAAEHLLAEETQKVHQKVGEWVADLRRQAQQEVFATCHRVLADLASVELQERIIDRFVVKMRQWDDRDKKVFSDAMEQDGDMAVVRVASALTLDQQAALTRALFEVFSREVKLRFETAPQLICGIELIAGGQALRWSLDHYMALLENHTRQWQLEHGNLDGQA